MEVGVESQVAVGALDVGHSAGLAGGQAAPGVALAIAVGHGVREDAQHLTQKLAVKREWEAQRERELRRGLRGRSPSELLYSGLFEVHGRQPRTQRHAANADVGMFC